MVRRYIPLPVQGFENVPRNPRVIRIFFIASISALVLVWYSSTADPQGKVYANFKDYLHSNQADREDPEFTSKNAQFRDLIAHLNPQSLQPSSNTNPNPQNLTIKYKSYNNRPNILPDEDDPWPQHQLVARYLGADRFNTSDGGGFDPPEPAFPDPANAKSFPTPKNFQVPFASLPNIQQARKVRHEQRHELPKIQASSFPKESAEAKIRRLKRRDWVRRTFRHSWESYKQRAWGSDEVMPVTGSPSSPFNGWGATIIDALDTLLIMDFQHEFNLAREHVRQVDFTLASHGGVGSSSQPIPTFESNIRYIGGLLGAYTLSQDPLMLERAQDVANWMMGAFASASGMPVARYTFPSSQTVAQQYVSRVCVAEAGSMSLELIYLSQMTNNTDYFDVAQRVTDGFDAMQTLATQVGNLLPIYVDPNSKQPVSNKYTFGGEVDSFYEYMIKTHQLLGLSPTDSQYAKMYTSAIDSAYRAELVRYVNPTPDSELMIWGIYLGTTFTPEMEHLACFTGAMTALSGKLLNRPSDLFVAGETADGCFQIYNATKSGIGAEITVYYKDEDPDKYRSVNPPEGEPYLEINGEPAGVRSGNTKYIGRPEAIESVFYMWRITGDPIWQDKGWIMFTNWVRSCLSDYGMASLHSVNSADPGKLDNMESFVFAETFKYYYLLFSDPDYISLDDFVFNTEAHPFRVPNEPKPKSFMDKVWSWFDAPPKKFWDGPDSAIEEFYADPHHTNGTGHGTYSQQRARTFG